MPLPAWRTRTERADDVTRVQEINADAFPTSEEAELVDALRTDPAWIDGLSLVSVDADDHPVGFALLTRCHIDDAPALCLAPCAVATEHQRTGAGSAAIIAALDAAREMGESTVVVLGHPDYYPRFGFRRAVGHGIRLSVEVPEEALMVLSLDGAEIPAGTVRYAAPFGI
ncbi:GNAT family N-acetyltransferase [Gordonia rubripertincta]|uniref:GNAT family N-acetyltransferase n=1 Tax=Gordonia rubripertincta TaxID=36822 RepID=UPI000B8D365C|nr:N-acetyltransferase [Gordonia rubripertincta]ASR03848.1 Acetyltransferase (GNAT) family protein [Gordonia rubripertincta]